MMNLKRMYEKELDRRIGRMIRKMNKREAEREKNWKKAATNFSGNMINKDLFERNEQ